MNEKLPSEVVCSDAKTVGEPLSVHGLDLSYFTGKLEGYLRAKGIPYRLREMDTAAFYRCARATGIAQMPQVELADGTWLTDTPRIIEYFEETQPNPKISPEDPTARYISELIEAFGDEWLWRPSLYYRWAFAADSRLLGERLARGMFRDLPLPLFLRRRVAIARQRWHFLLRDGVTKKTAPAIEGLYLETLDVLQGILSQRPFLMGQRPTQADYGFFGPMFRHFFSDPTPAQIMRDRAPTVLAWVSRMWNLAPADFDRAPMPEGVPIHLTGLADMLSRDFLPYLAANSASYFSGSKTTRFLSGGVAFVTPVNPYRVWRLQRLQERYAKLPLKAQTNVAGWLGAGARILENAPAGKIADPIPPLPINELGHGAKLDRQWRR
jgi:glutathione S-transferase